MAGRKRTVEMVFDIDVQHRLEVVEPSVLDDSQYHYECVENEKVDLPRLVMCGDHDTEQRVEDISEELDDLNFAHERELTEDSSQLPFICYLLPVK
jgi:hypothetical protein